MMSGAECTRHAPLPSVVFTASAACPFSPSTCRGGGPEPGVHAAISLLKGIAGDSAEGRAAIVATEGVPVLQALQQSIAGSSESTDAALAALLADLEEAQADLRRQEKERVAAEKAAAEAAADAAMASLLEEEEGTGQQAGQPAAATAAKTA